MPSLLAADFTNKGQTIVFDKYKEVKHVIHTKRIHTALCLAVIGAVS